MYPLYPSESLSERNVSLRFERLFLFFCRKIIKRIVKSAHFVDYRVLLFNYLDLRCYYLIRWKNIEIEEINTYIGGVNVKTVFNYANHGDILYGVENYRFRYNGRPAVEIELINLIDDGDFVFDFKIDDSIVLDNPKLRRMNFNDAENMELLGVEVTESPSTREAALQLAIDWSSKILEEYSDISVKRIKEKLANL